MLSPVMTVITILQVITGILMIGGILLQDPGSGLEGALGGGSGTGDAVHATRRGFDKFTFEATMVLATLFAALGVLSVIL